MLGTRQKKDSPTQPEACSTAGPGPVKVLFLSATGQAGGAERSLYELLCALPKDRIEARVCVPPEEPLVQLCAQAEVPVHPVPLRRFWRTLSPFLLAGQVRALYRASRAVKHVVEDQRIDVLHANTDSAALVAWEVGRETQRPVVWHCRDMRPLGPLARLLARSSMRVVAISKAVENHLLDQGVAPALIRRVENGIDLTRFPPPDQRASLRARTRAYLGVKPSAPLLMDIGAWVPWKRHELFLEALALVRAKHPDACGVLVGSDLFQENRSYADFLEARIDALRLDSSALLVLQQRQDVLDLLASADILVSPSEKEPFGRVLAEAGAAGLPVVSSNSGGKAEIVQEGETGRLVPPGDAMALAAACLDLLEDPEKRVRMGANATVRVAELFDVRRTANELTALFEEVAGRGEK